MEARRSERSSLHASAEVLLEASTDASTGSIRGSFQSHKKMRLSTSSMEASIVSTESSIAQASELHCRWKLPRKRCKLLRGLVEAKQAPTKVMEASNKSCRGSFCLWKHPITSAEAPSMETSTEAVEAMEAFMEAVEASRHRPLPWKLPRKQWKKWKLPWKQWKLPDTP